ncbi:proprotein convertase P-domain-containing protein [Pseudomarimonas salicorniae]|uniref:Proprotein convertase P-domain-containing protein n=1 Tax=Pseudomarimonas salicorniae TaxID=2933270 RepID=A0ABT0GII2_9GAMM|nr:proprotein convertase P-domain-containing protein [Lysobacter sp. CAU 1642]MCK7594351.1 proprotein convertase P-domain-containing protein [Lysobacter sp. CAU 1642]
MRVVLSPLAAALCLAFVAPSFAQVSPQDDAFLLGDALVLPSPDLTRILAEDAKAVGGAYRYGVSVAVPQAKAGGHWERTAKGDWVWSLELVSPAAKSLDFHFSRLFLPESAQLRIIGEGKGNQRVIQPHEVAGGAWYSPYVAGERARIEITVSARDKHRVQAELASVTHGYRGLFEGVEGQAKSGSCNVDTACPAGDAWRDQIDSVGHYTFSQGSSSYVCTGTLLANTANTTTPYFLTANHCLSTQTIASTVVVYWNYQSSTCRTPGSSSSGTPLSKTIASHSQSGSTLRATNAASDFTLLQLSSAVPTAANPYFSGWDRGTATPTSAVGIHHPSGHEKRIAVENQALQISAYGGGSGTTHWRVVDWDQGTTEGGSSGSGLWNQNKLLVGQLHGGSAACGNDLSDYYGRLSVSWTGGGTSSTRLSNWLDAGSTGVTTKAGYRAGGSTLIKYENTADYQIRDNATVDSPVTVSGRSGNMPSTLKVNVRIIHTYIGDLIVRLVAPDGSLYTLHNRTGGSADNIITTYTVNASSELANGTWKLRVQDAATGDTGYIDSWSLEF